MLTWEKIPGTALPMYTYLCSREGEPGNEAMAACMQKTLHICNGASRPPVRLPHWLHTFAWVRHSVSIDILATILKLQSTHTYINTHGGRYSTKATKITHLFSRETWVCPSVIVQEHPGLVMEGRVVHSASLHLQELWHPRCCLLPHIHTLTRHLMHPGRSKVK